MKPFVNKRYSHRVLGAPKDWNEGELGVCIGLPVHTNYASGVTFSWWKPSLWERVRILLGWPVQLSVASSSHPPVALEVRAE